MGILDSTAKKRGFDAAFAKLLWPLVINVFSYDSYSSLQ